VLSEAFFATPFITRETVAIETPARSATVAIETVWGRCLGILVMPDHIATCGGEGKAIR
jgi:hypothetical protein